MAKKEMGLTIDLSMVNLSEMETFFTNVRTGRFRATIPFISKVVESWSYKQDPKDEKAIRSIKLTPALRMMREVNTEVYNSFITAEPNTDVKLDIDQWELEDFLTFSELIDAGELEEALKLVTKVVLEWPFEGDPDNIDDYFEISVLELGGLIAAINEAIRGTFL